MFILLPDNKSILQWKCLEDAGEGHHGQAAAPVNPSPPTPPYLLQTRFDKIYFKKGTLTATLVAWVLIQIRLLTLREEEAVRGLHLSTYSKTTS
jgi:hypothetical protein